MTFRLMIAAVLLAGAAPALAMPVSTFLAKAEALQKKGPMALLSSDLKLLTNQVKQDAGALKAENKALEAAGRPKAYCTPGTGVKLTNCDVMAIMNAVPAAQRGTVHTKDALKGHFVRRYPCRA